MTDWVQLAFNDLYKAKQAGEFYCILSTPPSHVTKVVTALRKYNYLIIKDMSVGLIVMWAGSREWYSSMTRIGSYDRNKVFQLLLPWMDENMANIDISNMNFINPLINVKVSLINDLDGSTTGYDIQNKHTVTNRLWNVISKYKRDDRVENKPRV